MHADNVQDKNPVFVDLLPYITTVGCKSISQHVIEVLAFSSKSRGFTKMFHELF